MIATMLGIFPHIYPYFIIVYHYISPIYSPKVPGAPGVLGANPHNWGTQRPGPISESRSQGLVAVEGVEGAGTNWYRMGPPLQ